MGWTDAASLVAADVAARTIQDQLKKQGCRACGHAYGLALRRDALG
jgi:hypothetical protein